MNLLEAINSGLPIRRRSSPRISGSNGNGWVAPDYLVNVMGLHWDDVTAQDWEIQEPSVAITRTDFLNAIAQVQKNTGHHLSATAWSFFEDVGAYLGLEKRKT